MKKILPERLDAPIVLSTQLNDWGEDSARQIIALTEYFLEHYHIDPDRVYLLPMMKK